MASLKWAKALWYIGSKTTALASETAWVEIVDARVASGSFGKEWQTTEATTFADGYRRNAKTVFDAGQIELTVLRKIADAGQVALKAACDDEEDDPYNFRVVLRDGTEFKFRAQVHAFAGRAAAPTSLVEFMARLDLEDETIEVAA